MRSISHFIDGGSSVGGGRTSDVFDPNTGQIQAKVTLGDKALLDQAVSSAKAAQIEWAAMNPQRRARVMFEFKHLLEATPLRVILNDKTALLGAARYAALQASLI